MEIKFIKEFLVLAEMCNFQEAAEMLYISTSSLSKHIKTIEEELGGPLFDRTTRSVKLNECGDTFYEYARQMIKLYDDCTDALNELHINSDNTLSIGFLARFEQCGIVETISDFSKNDPRISLHMLASNQPKELLREQKCDFVFDSDSCQKDHDIEGLLYKTDHLVAVLPPDHPLSKEDHVTIEQLSDQEFIMHSDTSGDAAVRFENYRKLFQQAGFEPNVIMTASFTSTVVKLVKQGRGITIMNRMFVPAAIQSSVAVVDIHPIMPLSIYVLYLKNSIMSPAAKDFLRYIKTLGANKS